MAERARRPRAPARLDASRRRRRRRIRPGSRRARPRRRRAAARRARPAPRRRPGRPAAWSSGCTRTRDVARAQQHRVDRLAAATAATSSGRVASSLRTTWRASASAAPASARGHLLLQRVELRRRRTAISAPTCAVDLRGEALLEALERDQAVAVAVLVAGLARRAQLGGELARRVRCGSAGCVGARAVARGLAADSDPGSRPRRRRAPRAG